VELTITPLLHTRTLVFRQSNPVAPDVGGLLRLVADYIESEDATLLQLHYDNSLEGEDYDESLTVTVEVDPF
jgi:hypothetical protein